MLNDVSVVAREISKVYDVPVNGGRHLRGIWSGRTRTVEAVKSVSFVARQGEAIGILGRNGSGKSTLLRMIAGSETPTLGEVLVNGTPSLLGVSAALQPMLTGTENIKLGLLAIGLKWEEVKELIPNVMKLSSLPDEALERPMNTYSSGMQARLTFAIATAQDPDILMIDEALGTGDATFAETARKRMEKLLSGTGTVFVVSHSAATLRKTCKTALWIHDGQVVSAGSLSDISAEYAKWGEFTTNGESEKAQQVVDYALANYQPPKIVLKSEVYP